MASSSFQQRLSLQGLPLEKQVEIIEYVPTKHLFSLQLVSRHFHELASIKLYQSLVFILSYPDAPQYYRESQYRLADALQTFATSDYNYAQHVKKFQLRMSDNDTEDVQKRIASRYHVSEEPTMFLNMALLMMIKKARALESFNWDVPVELSPNVYDALSRVQSLQSLHIRLDVASITRVSTVTYGTSTSMGPEFVQLANTQYFPPVSGTAQSSWAPGALTSVTAANTSKLATMRIERRRFGNIHDLRELRITAIDNLDCLDQIKTCLAESTRSLRSLSLSLSHALVRKARKPASNAPAGPAVVDPADDDEAMTEPNTPDTNAQAPAAPNDADIKRERQAQELTLARILGFERLTAEDKRLDRSLKATAKYVKLNGATADQYQQLQQHLEAVVKSSALSHSERNRIQELVKSVNDRLDQSGLPKLSKKKPKSKSPKQTATSKSQPASFAWSTQAPPLPEDPTNWESFPTQPPAGSGSKGIANAGPFLYGAGAGPSVISEVLGDPQFIPSSSSHTSHTNYKVTNPKPVSTSYSYGVPKHLPPAQPPLFSHNAYSYSHAGTANGKPVTQPPSPEDPSGVDSDSDDRSSLDEFEKSKEGVDAGTADQADGLQNQENGLDVDVDMDHPDAGDESDGNEAASELSDAGNGGKLHDDSTEDVKMTDSSSLLKENDPLPNEATGINNGLTCSKPPNTRSTFHSAQEEKKVVEHDRSLGKTKNSEEVMQDYIRMTHGFSLEEFSLYLIPLKPSIIAKAFNLSCLRNLSLYSVGPQGAFWTMLEKSLAQGLELKLQIIRTDDVSNACVQCISKLNGLLQLHLTRRSTKDFDSTTTKAPATLDEIRKLILVKHLPTLQSLALTNNEDDKWELNGKCFRLLAAKGKQLKELAFSTDSSGFHIFVQCLPGMRSLEAVHFLGIRSQDRTSSLNRECRKFIVDVLHYCPELKLKFMAINSQVHQFSTKPKISLPAWLSKQEQALSSRLGKGKGKAVEPPGSAISAQHFDIESEDFSDLDEARPNVYVAKHWKLSDVPVPYAIFSTEVRKARL